MKKTNKKVIKEGFERRTVHTNPVPPTQRPQPDSPLTKNQLKRNNAMKQKDTKITHEDAGLIIGPNGDTAILLPKGFDKDGIPTNVKILANILKILESYDGVRMEINNTLVSFYKTLKERGWTPGSKIKRPTYPRSELTDKEKSEVETAKRIAEDWDTGC